MNIENIAYRSPHQLASLSQNEPVLLAFSGGADSSALLHLLAADAKQRGYKLHAAHFHHGIRGEEADRDAAFCQSAAQSYDVPFYLGRADVVALARENGNSVENEAREQRYSFFKRIMLEQGIKILVTAHHAEDQVESILLHVLRGSGIKGICGMWPCRELGDGLYLVRPLLEAQKCDILKLCKQNNIDFVTDSTNSDTQYARNALRHEVIPKLYELQPNLCAVLERLSKSAKDADEFIGHHADEFIKNECDEEIPLAKLNSLQAAVKARVLSSYFEKSFGAGLECVHIDALTQLCQRAVPHASVSLPRGICARIENGALIFCADIEKEDHEDFDIPFSEGSLCAQGTVIEIEKNTAKKADTNAIFLEIKCSSLQGGAHFRTRKEGDVIRSGKINKKVKKLMSEKKIPLALRARLPILAMGEEILWIPSVAVCDRIKADKINEEDFYRITIRFED